MSLTKVEMWLSIIGFTLIFAFSILAVGSDLRSSDVVLDNRSLEYIDEFSANINENDLESFATNQSLQNKETNPVVDAVTNLPIISDVVGGINFFIDKTKQVMGGLAIVYNLPTFFLMGLIPNYAGEFGHIVNIITAILFLAFTIIMVRLIK